MAEATHHGTEIQRAHHLRCNSSTLNHIDQFRLLRGVALKAQTALLGAQGKTVFDPDFDIDDSGCCRTRSRVSRRLNVRNGSLVDITAPFASCPLYC